MVLSRIGFGFLGNILPAGINALVAGVGWFAVNSVSGAFALNALLGWNAKLCLLIIVVVADRASRSSATTWCTPSSGTPSRCWSIIFLIASVVIVAKAHPSAPRDRRPRRLADHPRRGLRVRRRLEPVRLRLHPLPADGLQPPGRRACGPAWASSISCVLLEVVGAAAATVTSIDKYADNPTAGFISHLPTGIADVTLLAIALGAICANALNVYSGSMSFLALGVKLPLSLRRAIVAVVFGVAGFFLALSGLSDAGTKYENFLLVIAYWIGPWLGVFFADQWLRRGKQVDGLLFDRKHNPWGGSRRDGRRGSRVDLAVRQPDWQSRLRGPGSQAPPGVR